MINWSGWAIDKQLYEWIKTNLSIGKSILEIGSGESTSELIKFWNVYSVEEDINWINKYHENYIHAPILNDYYDLNVLEQKLPNTYDLLLVDGPAYGDRKKMIEHIKLFNLETCGCKLFVFDDVERENDYNCYLSFLEELKKIHTIKDTQVIKNIKSFAYIIVA